jgi:nucleotide-binding universal stress UspA family protein
VSEAAAGPVHLNTILFPTDFSESSLAALGYAISLAEKYEATLNLMHVVSQRAVRRSQAEAAESAKQRLNKLIPPGRLKIDKVKKVVRIGKPYSHILHLAKEIQTDLVVMAVRGHHSTDLTVFGSTTHRMIQLGPCPVLVVPA